MSKPPPNLWVLWAAHGFAQVAIFAVSFFVPAQPAEPLIQLAALVGALAVAGLSVATPLVLPRLVEPTRIILRMAFAEAAGLFGLLAWFVSGERLVQSACLGLGLLALALAAPVGGGRRG